MALIQHFMINGKYYGTTERQLFAEPGSVAVPPASLLFYCHCCGKVYATCPVEDTINNTVIPWQAFRGCCQNCPSMSVFLLPGVLWSDYDLQFSKALPREWLLQEFFLTYKWLDAKGRLS